jgi:hypothetical protein
MYVRDRLIGRVSKSDLDERERQPKVAGDERIENLEPNGVAEARVLDNPIAAKPRGAEDPVRQRAHSARTSATLWSNLAAERLAGIQ